MTTTTSNENFDPRSLPSLSNLLTHPAHKRNNKHEDHKASLAGPGLRESFLHNVPTHQPSTLESSVEIQLPMPPTSQSIVLSRDKAAEETRLPISPPPEEEIRIKQLSAHGTTPKEPYSRLPVRSRSGAFKVPGLPQSSTRFQPQAPQPASGESAQGTDPITSPTTSTSTASESNPRKRSRSVLPSCSPHGNSASIPTGFNSPVQSNPIIPSPNPKARKQPKKHDTGQYMGSGFKRRHKRGTSAESLDNGDESHIVSSASASLKSPARKKRQDLGVEDYTPQRDQASISTATGSATKRKSRVGRSATPDVRYEPPTEQFTPPRDVVLQIPSSTASLRSRKPRSSSFTGLKSSVDKKVVKVKVERLTSPFPLPPLDLSKPVPPPSPTDDPLLLVGPPTIVRRSATPIVVANKTLVDVSVGDAVDCINNDVVHSRPQPAIAAFDPNESTGSHIFHSDDESADAGEDEGEFTGRFKFYSVPVKHDPPSSATRARRESWGRPVSPFPFAKRSSGPPSHDVTIRGRQVIFDEDSPPPSPSAGRRKSVLPPQETEAPSSALEAPGEAPCTRGFTLSEMEARLESRVAQGKTKDVEVSLQPADHESMTYHMHNWEGTPSDDDDDDDVGSVERQITPIDNLGQTTPDDTTQTLGATTTAPKHLTDQQAYLEVQNHGQQGTLVDEGEESVIREHSIDATTHHAHTSPSHTVSPTLCVSPGRLVASIASVKASQSTDEYATLCIQSGLNSLEFQGIYDDDDGSYDEESPPPGVVEVSSDDPKAAARAAAILKLHHSYVVDGLVAQHARRRSPCGYIRQSPCTFEKENIGGGHDDEIIRRVRRKGIAASAGVMQHRSRPMIASPIVGSTFIAPGSPSLPSMSPEDALRDAETDIRAASASPGRLRTPLRPASLADESAGHYSMNLPSVTVNSRPDTDALPRRTESVKEWTRAHWKALDMCFTDERLVVGGAMRLESRLAAVEDIEIASVVERFLGQMEDNDYWDHDMLLRRAAALSARQRAGNGAPPSPALLVSRQSAPEIVVPVFTPTVSRALSPAIEIGVPAKLPPSLLAPRYAHLHEELTPGTPTLPLPMSTPSSMTADSVTRENQAQAVYSRESSQVSTPDPAIPSQPSGGDVSVPASATKRVLSYLGSFVSRSTPAPQPFLRPGFNALPLPPPEMQQVVRGPINTPAKKPIPKSQAPRDLVQLTGTQLPAKQTQFPKLKSAKDMVSLNHVEPPRSVQRTRTVSGPMIIPERTRKDSGGSVKDLIKTFEAVQKNTEEEVKRSNSRLAVRQVASVGNLNTRPIWKP